MKISFELTREGAVAALGQRTVNAVVRDALEVAGLAWHDRFIAKHFTKAGAREYGYAPRKGERAQAGSKRFRRTAGPAERRAGQILPLVYSGALRAGAKTRRIQATATAARTVVYVVLPRANRANLRPSKAPQINMREELTTISEAEKAALVEILNREVIRGFSRLSGRRSRRIA